jgi:hypothetical protein
VRTPLGLRYAPARLTIGSLTDFGQYPMDGKIYRVLIANPAPTPTEHAAILAYLRAQYPTLGIAA